MKSKLAVAVPVTLALFAGLIAGALSPSLAGLQQRPPRSQTCRVPRLADQELYKFLYAKREGFFVAGTTHFNDPDRPPGTLTLRLVDIGKGFAELKTFEMAPRVMEVGQHPRDQNVRCICVVTWALEPAGGVIQQSGFTLADGRAYCLTTPFVSMVRPKETQNEPCCEEADISVVQLIRAKKGALATVTYATDPTAFAVDTGEEVNRPGEEPIEEIFSTPYPPARIDRDPTLPTTDVTDQDGDRWVSFCDMPASIFAPKGGAPLTVETAQDFRTWFVCRRDVRLLGNIAWGDRATDVVGVQVRCEVTARTGPTIQEPTVGADVYRASLNRYYQNNDRLRAQWVPQ